ncbi:MAG: alpha-ketoacid dehydrogenase subunit beta [Deltaproteobacteria bacterium]|nr:alpha-ketoacid dehydrogenase subunit beta [Deltaproteobacteria bacterium]
MREVTYLEAIREALWEEMEKDDSVFILGEDVGAYGGAFKVTDGLLKRFGEWRCLDTPLAEMAIVGAAIGASLMGMRPVAEIQFSDFMISAFDQICNMAAMYHYRLGEPVPIVIRAPFGGGFRGGPFHSQCAEAWYCHMPGLKVVAPATPYDAKGLLKASIRDPNPVIYFEHKHLYRRIKAQIPDDDFMVPLGQAEVKREGTDITIVTYSAMLHHSLAAAEEIAKEGVSAEVVDLRTLSPLDKATVLGSVRKTGKALVVYEAHKTFGVGAEVSALIAEEAFTALDGPVARVASLDTPVPFSPPLEEAYLPNRDKILKALRDLAAF